MLLLPSGFICCGSLECLTLYSLLECPEMCLNKIYSVIIIIVIVIIIVLPSGTEMSKEVIVEVSLFIMLLFGVFPPEGEI